jgi:hypothetical protein
LIQEERGMKKLILLGLAVLALGSCENEAETETRYIANEVIVPKGIRIETAEQLAGIGLSEEYPLDGEYYLANDIDLSVLWEEDPDDPPETPYVWRSIGSTCRECRGPLLPTPDTNGNRTLHALPLSCANDSCPLYNAGQWPFYGVLNGDGKTISGLKLPSGTERSGYKDALYLGLFGYVYAAYIHDLTVKIANTNEARAVYAGSGGDVRPCIGTLAGLASSSRIENVQIEAEGEGMGLYVTGGAANAHYNQIGGVIGMGLNATLKNVTSSAPLDVQGVAYEVVGGIAGGILDGTGNNNPAGEISGAKVTGNITVTSTGQSTAVAGISPAAGKIENCEVEMEELSLTTALTSSTGGSAALAGIGYAPALADCAVDIETIKLMDNDTGTGARSLCVGGISSARIQANASLSNITTPIERCGIRFGKLEVSSGESAAVGNVYVGGVVGYLGSTQTLSGYSIESGEIAVSLKKSLTLAPYIGGLAAQGNISDSSVSGKLKISVTTDKTGAVTSYTGGLTGNGSVSGGTIDELLMSVTTGMAAATTRETGYAYTGGLTGNGSVSGSAIDQLNMSVTTKTTGAGYAYVYTGGLTGYGSVSGSAVDQLLMSVPTETAGTGPVYVYTGGLAGNGSVSGGTIDQLLMSVTTGTTGTGGVYVGGLTGYGAISHCGVKVAEIALTTATTATVYTGGLAGYGVAEYSFIGTKESPAKVEVTKNDTTSQRSTNQAYIGGVSGQAAPTAALPFRYNYAFCDVSLETTAATEYAYGQSVGGLAGYVSSTSPFIESFAAGKVTVTDNCASNTTNTRFNVGGISGWGVANAGITKCAALNGSITVGGSNSASSAKYWRRIVCININASTPISSTANNITTVTATPPSWYTPTNGATNHQDGSLIASIEADTFFGTGQLGWNQEVWEWDAASGYPVLKQ